MFFTKNAVNQKLPVKSQNKNKQPEHKSTNMSFCFKSTKKTYKFKKKHFYQDPERNAFWLVICNQKPPTNIPWQGVLVETVWTPQTRCTWGTQNHQKPGFWYLKTRLFGGENLCFSWLSGCSWYSVFSRSSWPRKSCLTTFVLAWTERSVLDS